MLKTCSKCRIDKELSDFAKARQATGHRAARRGQGVAAVCRYCVAEIRKPGIHARTAARLALRMAGLKECGACHIEKPLSDYHVRKASPDGLAYKCDDCIIKTCASWRKENPNAFREWSDANIERRQSYGRDWRGKNKEHCVARYREWAKSNPGVVNALVAKRTAAELRATPSWADFDAIKAFYERASKLTAETGVRHEVDHIYPLQGKTVCGLHWEANLQILTKAENLRKSNRVLELTHEPKRHFGDDEGHRACSP